MKSEDRLSAQDLCEMVSKKLAGVTVETYHHKNCVCDIVDQGLNQLRGDLRVLLYIIAKDGGPRGVRVARPIAEAMGYRCAACEGYGVRGLHYCSPCEGRGWLLPEMPST